MKKIYLFLITGFEEMEALGTLDVLRRAGLPAQSVSLTSDLLVTGSHGIPVMADLLFGDADFSEAEMLVLPGGTTAYDGHQEFKKLILSHYERGGKIAAICASPMVFGGLGLLRDKKATCYPGFEKYLDGALLHTKEPVVRDGHVVTGRGPGWTIDFALALVEYLAGKARRDEIAGQLLVE